MRRTRSNGADPRWRGLAAGLILALVAGCGEGGRAPANATRTVDAVPLELVPVSNRADLVSGGDVLVEILGVADVAALTVMLGPREVSDAFARRDNGRVMGRVTGLAPGGNELTASVAGGSAVRLTVDNHPIGGPIFSGPQIEPWVCTTESNGLGPPLDAQCNAPTIHMYYYMPVGGTGSCPLGPVCASALQPYDPDNPPNPALIADTTTDQGETVPYIVRHERGTSNRGIHDIAMLYNPDEPWEPWAPQRGWNGKLAFTFGTGCSPVHSQGSAMDPLNHDFLSRGFMTAVSTRNNFGNGCNLNVAAEAVMMIKEHIVERYGEIRYTLGDGCSGGAENQHSLAENYPGLLDGIRPECTFADGWTPALWDKGDCPLLIRYFDAHAAVWPLEAERAAVTGGYQTTSICQLQDGLAVWDPSTGCGLPEEQQYHPETNPTGARCTMQDYNVAAIGRRPDGFAYKLYDYVGVQWGLLALIDGTISPEQFVHLNENVGSYDIDFQWRPERTEADLEGLRNFYRSGQFTWGRNLAKLPSIDVRGNWTADFHSNRHRDIVRQRLLRSWGTTDSQVYWFEPYTTAVGLPTPPMQELSFLLMDEWVAAIAQDDSTDPIEMKVARHRPAAAEDGCFAGGQPAPQTLCDVAYEPNLLPRQVAGQPLTADVLKCQLKPLDPADYPGITFSDELWGRLQATFPEGVCDWTQPGVGQQPPVGGWLTFEGGPGGRSLGPAPRSEAF